MLESSERTEQTWWVSPVIVALVAAALIVVHLQSYVAVQNAETRLSGTDTHILVWLVIASVAASLAGWVLGNLVLRGGVRLALALGVIAPTLPLWLADTGRLVTDPLTVAIGQPTALRSIISTGAWWIVTVVFLATALIMIGVRPRWRLVVWPLPLVIAWLTASLHFPIAVMGGWLDSGAGLAEAASQAADVFWISLKPGVEAPIAYVAAVAVAVTLVIARRNVTLRRRTERMALHPTQHQRM